jgi:C4-type Zn-finger protein
MKTKHWISFLSLKDFDVSVKTFLKKAVCHHEYECDFHFFDDYIIKDFVCKKCEYRQSFRSKEPVRNVYINTKKDKQSFVIK